MPRVLSRRFGTVEYAPGEEFVFPSGLPGFAGERCFLPVEVPEQLPLVYLQSVHTPELCFVAAPVSSVVDDYDPFANPEDLHLIGLAPEGVREKETLWLALLCVGGDGAATANLRAPVIVNLRNRKAVQSIREDDRYPFRFELKVGGAVC